jgi:1-deoxy-D-xylulose-5-phosphate reductoisomerase
MAYDALAMGGVKPAILNAANEVAVDAFLAGKIRFTRIAEIVAKALKSTIQGDELDLEVILAADKDARIVAEQEIQAA